MTEICWFCGEKLELEDVWYYLDMPHCVACIDWLVLSNVVEDDEEYTVFEVGDFGLEYLAPDELDALVEELRQLRLRTQPRGVMGRLKSWVGLGDS